MSFPVFPVCIFVYVSSVYICVCAFMCAREYVCMYRIYIYIYGGGGGGMYSFHQFFHVPISFSVSCAFHSLLVSFRKMSHCPSHFL